MTAISELYKDEVGWRECLQPWERDALVKFEKKMVVKVSPFPCIPATVGFSLNHFRYAFVGDPLEDKTVYELADVLKCYVKQCKEFGNYTSLIVFYNIREEMKNKYSVEQYEQLFWKQLSGLSSIDEKEWPEEIPADPHHPVWEFCFHGEQLFMYCATPAHERRKSRNFSTMMLAITPRWVLEKFHRSSSFVDKIRSGIRKRLTKYDTAPIHKDLNIYGSGDNFEWKQYFLRDDESVISKCPYHRFLERFKSSK